MKANRLAIDTLTASSFRMSCRLRDAAIGIVAAFLLSACGRDSRSGNAMREAGKEANAELACAAEVYLGPPMTADFDARVAEISRWINERVQDPEVLAMAREDDPAVRGEQLEMTAWTPCPAAGGIFAIRLPQSEAAHEPSAALPRLSVSLVSIALDREWIDYYPRLMRGEPAAVPVGGLYKALKTMDPARIPRTVAFDGRVRVRALHRVLATLRSVGAADTKLLVRTPHGTSTVAWTFIRSLGRTQTTAWIIDADANRMRVTNVGFARTEDEVLFEGIRGSTSRDLAKDLGDAYRRRSFSVSPFVVTLRLSADLHVQDAVNIVDGLRAGLGVDMRHTVVLTAEPPMFE